MSRRVLACQAGRGTLLFSVEKVAVRRVAYIRYDVDENHRSVADDDDGVGVDDGCGQSPCPCPYCQSPNHLLVSVDAEDEENELVVVLGAWLGHVNALAEEADCVAGELREARGCVLHSLEFLHA